MKEGWECALALNTTLPQPGSEPFLLPGPFLLLMAQREEDLVIAQILLEWPSVGEVQ